MNSYPGLLMVLVPIFHGRGCKSLNSNLQHQSNFPCRFYFLQVNFAFHANIYGELTENTLQYMPQV